jgi:hypothetical protein
MADRKRGPVEHGERALYRARLPNDAEAGRPTTTTAGKICELLDVDPATLQVAREREGHVAAQAFVVALDTVLALGDREEQLTVNMIFGALARYWSLSYRAAQLGGAMVTYDMTEQRIKDAARELTAAGVNVEAIWTLLRDGPAETKLSQIYDLVRLPGRGHARGRRVELFDSPLLDDVRYTVLRDPQYERPVRLRLLRANEKAPELPLRQDVCEERGYNVVNLGDRSRRVLDDILGAARARFYVEQFREDYETFDHYLKIHPRNSTRAQRAGRDRLAGVVANLRTIYEQTAGIVPENDGQALARDGGREKDGYITIRSRFFRAAHRRFYAADFWPEHVPGELRERWFGLDPITSRFGKELDEDERLVNREFASAYVERDVSASQTQILAAFLGNDALFALAASRSPKFKVYLAQQLWALHEKHNVLKEGYDGAGDKRLVEFIGETWMRRNYGGKLGQTVLDLANDPQTFGPGWNTNVFATGGIQNADRYFRMFLSALPPEWSGDVELFLHACEYIGKHAAPHGGVVFHDPLDGAEVRWNPIRRATKKIPVFNAPLYVEAQLSGVVRKVGRSRRFLAQPWRVDGRELSQNVAPYLVHTLDAYFNALVIEELRGEGAENIVAIHDSWFVPRLVEYWDRPGAQSGEQALASAIWHASRDWISDNNTPDSWDSWQVWDELPGPPSPEYARYLREFQPPGNGIGMVYEWFLKELTGSPYESFAKKVYDRWRQRLAEGRYPMFTAV